MLSLLVLFTHTNTRSGLVVCVQVVLPDKVLAVAAKDPTEAVATSVKVGGFGSRGVVLSGE